MVIRLLNKVKQNNIFAFGDRVFKQTTGTSIGQKQAPPYACLGAGRLEEKKIFPSKEFQEFILDDLESQDPKDRWFRRFIDDMIGLFLGDRKQAEEFVKMLNNLEPGITFTFEWSDKTINFLDVQLEVVDGSLKTNLFIKPTNPQLYLHYQSNHPAHVFTAIPYGQAVRIRTICSEPEFVGAHLENLKTKLLDRGYPEQMIMEQFRRSATFDRQQFLKPTQYPMAPYQHQLVPTNQHLSLLIIPQFPGGSTNTRTSLCRTLK